MQYDDEIREKVIRFIEAGNARYKAAEVFGISYGTICRWCQAYKKTGNTASAPRQPREHRKIDPEQLRAFYKENPKALLKEAAAIFDCAEGSISRTVKKYGISRINFHKLDPVKLKAFMKKHPNSTNAKIAKAFDCVEDTVRVARKRWGM
jgi:transposase-like protein